MRLCIGIEPGESLRQAEDLKGALQAVCPASKIDIAAYIDDNGPAVQPNKVSCPMKDCAYMDFDPDPELVRKSFANHLHDFHQVDLP